MNQNQLRYTRTSPFCCCSLNLGVNETSFYGTLESEGVPLTNKTVDLMLNNVTVNSSALIAELQRIQARDPEFVPLLETLFVDSVSFDVR